MTFELFEQYSKEFNLLPVYRIIKSDLYTPISIFLKLRKHYIKMFLLESAEVDEKFGRYSFIGIEPTNIIKLTDGKLFYNNEIVENDLFNFLNSLLKNISYPKLDELSYFKGGFVGYLAYEIINTIEPTVKFNYELPEYPLAYLCEFNKIIAIDHFKHNISIIKNVKLNSDSNLKNEYYSATQEIDEIIKIIDKETITINSIKVEDETKSIQSNEKLVSMIEKAKNYIYEGDIFQVVLSNKFIKQFEGDTFELYRNLRNINPSPYMFYFAVDDDLKIIGASPESLVSCIDKSITINPIAGTRKRGKDKEDEEKLIENLLNDSKEKAEHLMLVDLARNDIGRVSQIGSVEVKEYLQLKKFSHVMHLVSTIKGILKDDFTVIDLLKYCFPAGTVSGAPKIRAMQIISELENYYRGIYSGALGYIDYSQNLDFCITIRTFVAYKNKLELQAGAGIVADSKPALEIKEINNKVAVLFEALKKE